MSLNIQEQLRQSPHAQPAQSHEPFTRNAFAPKPRSQQPLSHTTGETLPTWDRLRFEAHTQPLRYNDEDEDLTLPLPMQAPDPRITATRIALHSIEVLTGHRKPQHLQNWLTREVFEKLVRRAGLGLRLNGNIREPLPAPQCCRVFVCRPCSRVAQTSLVVHDGRRIRAVALRLEYRRGRWRGTALDIG